jgi:phage terminase small subunit
MLTKNQEAFVQAIMEGKNQAEAYRLAYPQQRSADKTIWEAASRLMKNSKVVARIEELREQLMKPTIMTAQERLELLSRIAKGEESERVVQFVNGERFEYEIPASLKTRREAIDIMNKMTGEYVQKVEADVKSEVIINIELSDDDE